VGWHRVASQQVVEADVLYLVDGGPARHQLIDPGHCAHIDRQAHQRIDNFLAPLLGGGRYGQQHLGDIVLGHQLLELPGVRDLQAIDHRVLQVSVVIDEYHHPVLVPLMQCRQQLAPGFAGAVDNHILRQGAQFGLVIGAHGQAGTADAEKGEGEIDKGGGSRHARLAEKYRGPEDQAGIAHRREHGPDCLLPHEADNRPVQAQPQENHRA